MSGRRSRCAHRYCTDGSSSLVHPHPPPLTAPTTTITHTNGVFAWLVNRADCSHLTGFRFKYLSVSWWAKSALTVRLLFKVADRRLGERAGEREGEKKHPSLAGEMGFISMCSYSVMVPFFFFFFSFPPPAWIAASVRLPLLPCNNVLVSWPRLSGELALRELLVD